MTSTEENNMILFWQHTPTPRMEYVLQFLFNEALGLTISLTSDQESFLSSAQAKISYGTSFRPDIPMIGDEGLLKETGLRHTCPTFIFQDSVPILFPVTEHDPCLNFDIFSAIFWLLSRYEEYLPFTPDTHNRFPAEASILYKSGLLETPVVDLWVDMLRESLQHYYPDLKFPSRSYQYIPTIDIDSAWAYRHKPIWRQLGGLFSTIISLQWPQTAERVLVFLKLKKDPFDTFELIHNIHRDIEKPIFFYLVGEYGPYDKNIPAGNKHFRRLIRHNHLKGGTGLHPSYGSGGKPEQLKKEKQLLDRILENPVACSRQHYLRIKIPDTCRHLEQAGIQEDYSLGFANQPGFRAGTCSTFLFYDLPGERTTRLRMVPLTVMDGTFKDYLHLDTKEAFARIEKLNQITRKYRGVFVTLWHNETLGEQKRWKGWSALYRRVTQLCTGTQTENEFSSSGVQEEKPLKADV